MSPVYNNNDHTGSNTGSHMTVSKKKSLKVLLVYNMRLSCSIIEFLGALSVLPACAAI